MVPPKGVSFARSGSTWIHWWSPVASAKASMSFWDTSCQPETPSSSPSACLSSSSPVMVRIAGTLCTHYVALPGGQGHGTHPRGPRLRGRAADQRRAGLARRPPATAGGTLMAPLENPLLVTDAPHLLYREIGRAHV